MNQKIYFDDKCFGFISNWLWWLRNEPDIEIWINEYNILRNGMILAFPSEAIKLLFILRWL